MENPTPAEETPGTAPETITPDPSQTSPVQDEIVREQGKQGRSEKEKAEFSLKKNAERAKELGIDPAEVLGLNKAPEISTDDDAPATMGAVRAILADKEKETAFELADQIEDEGVRDLTKLYLKRIIPSGDAREDLRLARLAAESAKNSKVLEEVARTGQPRGHASGPGAPAVVEKPQEELSRDEQQFLKPPFSMTREEIIKARPKA